MNNEVSTGLDLYRKTEISRVGIDIESDFLIKAVKEGELDPLQGRAVIKERMDIYERFNKETQAEQLRAADIYPGNKFTAFGVEFTKGDVYTKYEYEVCNDPIYNQRLAILEAATEQLKQREAFLKNVKEPMTIINEETGEAITIYPPSKKTTPGLKLSIK